MDCQGVQEDPEEKDSPEEVDAGGVSELDWASEIQDTTDPATEETAGQRVIRELLQMYQEIEIWYQDPCESGVSCLCLLGLYETRVPVPSGDPGTL